MIIKLSNGNNLHDVKFIVPNNLQEKLSNEGLELFKNNIFKFNNTTKHWSLK